MLYIEYNFHRWLADVGPTLARRSKSRWPNVGSQRQTDGCADVGPTSVRRWNAIWVVSKTIQFLKMLYTNPGLKSLAPYMTLYMDRIEIILLTFEISLHNIQYSEI